ncbi:anti-sigma factor [soil metagenome]
MTTPDSPGDDTTDVRDLLGAYALDAVDDVERRKVEKLLASDPDAAREVDSLRATAAMLGAAVSAAPPPELRRSVLDQLSQTRQAGTPVAAAATPPKKLRGPSRRTVWLAVAATALVAAGVPSAVAWRQTQEIHRVEQQAQGVVDLLADPRAQVRRAVVPGGGTVVGVLAEDQALFTATGLKEPGPGKVYQLWVIRDGVPLPDAVMTKGTGVARATDDGYVVLTHGYAAGDSLAVTVEPTGGSVKPTTSPIVVLAPA